MSASEHNKDAPTLFAALEFELLAAQRFTWQPFCLLVHTMNMQRVKNGRVLQLKQ